MTMKGYNYNSLKNYLEDISNINVNSETSVNAYVNGATTVAGAYNGSIYSPSQNRIYFSPYAQASETTWHYVDCNTGAIVSYTHGATAIVNSAYYGGVYSPTQNRIYFIPYDIGPEATWHYIDCYDGSVVAYTPNIPTESSGAAYNGASYSPTENRIYFSPRSEGIQTDWHYLKPLTSAVASISFASSVLMGN